MSKNLVTLYTADQFAIAELIHQALSDANIEAFVKQTPSPLDGLSAINQGTPIMVAAEDLDKARAVVESFLAEHDEE